MTRTNIPELQKYQLLIRFLDKRLLLKLNGNRRVAGILRGFDPFMNIVMEDSVEVISEKESTPIGSIVIMVNQVIRGNSIIMMEALERIPL